MLEHLRRWLGDRGQAPVARALPGVPGRIHRKDTMLYNEAPEHVAAYLRAGRSAVECLERALAAEQRSFPDVRAVLDFGCGYGRVLRHLVATVPRSRVTASDVDADAVAFCRSEFGVQGIVSSWNPDELQLGRYDLVWSGSVLTHCAEPQAHSLLRKLGNALLPGGLLVFSTQGQFCLDNLENLYGGAHAAIAAEVRQEVAAHGTAFRPYGAAYPDLPLTYGMTWHTREYLERTVQQLFGDTLRLSLFTPQAWDYHHDVCSLQRTR